MPASMPLKAVAFDWGHTLMDERRDEHVPLDARPVHLMPGVADVLPQLALPLAVWANTRVVGEAAVLIDSSRDPATSESAAAAVPGRCSRVCRRAGSGRDRNPGGPGRRCFRCRRTPEFPRRVCRQPTSSNT